MSFTSRFSLLRMLVLGSMTALGCAGDDPESSDEPETEELGKWQTAISEESAHPATCARSPIDQIRCTGKYCDNIAIHCSDNLRLKKLSSRWVGPTTDGQSATGCNTGDDELITGVSCAGSYCDDVSVECSRFEGLHLGYVPRNDDSGLLTPDKGLTGEVSEEGSGILEFKSDHYPYLLACLGSYCDRLQFMTKRMDLAP